MSSYCDSLIYNSFIVSQLLDLEKMVVVTSELEGSLEWADRFVAERGELAREHPGKINGTVVKGLISDIQVGDVYAWCVCVRVYV